MALDPKIQANMAWIKAGEIKGAATVTNDYKVGECLEYLSLAIREIADRQNTILRRQEAVIAKLLKS